MPVDLWFTCNGGYKLGGQVESFGVGMFIQWLLGLGGGPLSVLLGRVVIWGLACGVLSKSTISREKV